jgi:uncharacterized OB-fold protein
MAWRCYKDKTEMAETEVTLIYLSHDDFHRDFNFKGLRCPKCGVIYIPEEMATGRLATAEGIAEGK